MPGPSRKLLPIQQKRIQRLYAEGATLRVLSEEYGVSQATIRKYVSDAVAVRRRGYERGSYRGTDHHNWQGGRVVRNGYAYLRLYEDDPMWPMAAKSGLVAEHRLVMARHLGRPLTPDERVHHINGLRDDNRIENLELWLTSQMDQPYGQRVTDLVAWAHEILERYA